MLEFNPNDNNASVDDEAVAKKNYGHMGETDNRRIIEKCGEHMIGKDAVPTRETCSLSMGEKDDITMADAENIVGVIRVHHNSSTQPEAVGIVNRTEVPTPAVKGITTIKIAHGQLLHFKSADVHDPRQISFATNISRLERVWDDEGPNWDPVDCGTNLLSISGTPIALRYWPEVFSGKKDARWRALKKNWTEWKVSFNSF